MSWSWPWTGLLRDLVEVRGSEQQLCQYVAVLSGIRRSLDDWIPINRFDAYKLFAARLGLVVEVDCLFKPITDDAPVFGTNYMPTTRAAGACYHHGVDDNPATSVHVVVSSRSDWAAEALGSSWYSVAVDGRIVRKPLVDHVRFGRALGYPECCIQFFIRNNDFPRLNTIAQAAHASTTIHWEANCLAKHTPWMTIFHMPCSFDCGATRTYTAAVLSEVKRLDSDYTLKVESFLRQRFLLINEILCYALVNTRASADGRLAYDHALYVGYGDNNDRYGRILAKGNELEIADGILFSGIDLLEKVLGMSFRRSCWERFSSANSPVTVWRTPSAAT
jgi:hypothetical protein